MSIAQAYLFEWAFAHLKQSDIFTAIAAGSLNKKLPYAEFTPGTMEKDIRSDAAYFGKGDSFARNVFAVTETTAFGRTFDATSESLAWAISLIMGSISTSGTGPTWTHTITWQDPTTSHECLYTTVMEKAGDEYQDILSGVWLEQCTLTATATDLIRLALTARARKRAADATALPAITNTTFFQSNYATFTFGEKDSAVSVSEAVQGWTLTLSQNPDVRYAAGQSSGDEKSPRYALIGRQSVSGSISLFIDAARRSLFINDTICELTIVSKGISDVNHTMTITIPKFRIQSEALAQDGETTVVTFAFNEETVLKDDAISSSPIEIELVNGLSALAA